MVLIPFGRAEDGVTSSTIIIGQSVSLTGPTGSLGEEMRRGALAYFEKINREGGINGRKIILKTLDDAYEVNRTVANVTQLIEKDKVFALFGLRGTSHVNAAAKIFTPAKVPLIGPFTGAKAIRIPLNHYIFHVRASYADETERLIQQVTSFGIKNIAVFYQNDGYGKEGLSAAEAAMKQYGLKPIAVGLVETNSNDVNNAVNAIVKEAPQAILLYANYEASAAFVRKMHAVKSQPQFMGLSIIDIEALAKELGAESRGIGTSQVVPNVNSTGVKVVKEYQHDMKVFSPNANYSFLSLESYISAKTLVEGLRRTGSNPTREKLIAALESMTDYDMGGFVIKYSPDSHEGSKYTDLTVIGPEGKILH